MEILDREAVRDKGNREAVLVKSGKVKGWKDLSVKMLER